MIGDYKCDESGITELNLTKYRNLKSVTIGDNSFPYVSELKIVGMEELESVEIGASSFSLSEGHFYLKNCPKLKSLKIGSYSFSDYTVCEIENVPALETVEIGDLNDNSYNFAYASLELKGGSISRRVMTRHACSQITCLWLECIPAVLSCCV